MKSRFFLLGARKSASVRWRLLTRLLTRVETERIRWLLFEPPKKAPKNNHGGAGFFTHYHVRGREPCAGALRLRSLFFGVLITGEKLQLTLFAPRIALLRRKLGE